MAASPRGSSRVRMAAWFTLVTRAPPAVRAAPAVRVEQIDVQGPAAGGTTWIHSATPLTILPSSAQPNQLTPPQPQGPAPLPYQPQGPLLVEPVGGERPLKGYGERKYRHSFRTFKENLDCQQFTYARGCGGRSRGAAGHCIWCAGIDECVQGTIHGGPDEHGKAQLAMKSVVCDRWVVTLI